MADYYIDEVKGGAGPGNRGDNFAVFRRAPATDSHLLGRGRGEFRMHTSDWIARGRPTRIEVFLGPEGVTPDHTNGSTNHA